ncbi:glycosyl hydrolase family 18 protein [Oceanobacillus sp. M60]
MPLRNIIVVIIFIFIIGGCSAAEEEKATPMLKPSEGVDDISVKTSIWIVDWDAEKSLDDVSSSLSNVDNIILFGNYFDENEKLFTTLEGQYLIDELLQQPIRANKQVYLSLVNDQFLEDGSTIPKSPDLIKNLMQSEETRKKHIEEIMNYAVSMPIDGVEIDYEKIPEENISSYLQFLEELSEQLSGKGLALRVVLEPSFPVEQYTLPEHIDYSIMTYNLYGMHSGPGPKTDINFLKSIADMYSNQAASVEFALSTGGFSWKDDHVTSLTENEVEDLISINNVTPVRDHASGALTFIYEEEKKEVEVWYADAETLTEWAKILAEEGEYYTFSFWRAGGLSEDTLRRINHLEEVLTQINKEEA